MSYAELLPPGPPTEWDMKTLTFEQLEYERNLCKQVLYGTYLPEMNLRIAGLLEQTANQMRVNQKTYDDAVRVWQLRLQRAEDEIFERCLISES